MWFIIPYTRTHSLYTYNHHFFPHESRALFFAILLEYVSLRSYCALLKLWTGGVFGAGCRTSTAFIQDPSP